MSEPTPRLTAVVVHWRDEEHLAELVEAWPREDAFELLVVDNSGTLDLLPEPARLISPGRNLGFAGGVNRGLAVARAPWILILNPDARPETGAVEQLALSCEAAIGAGVVPALVDGEGSSQHRWQLQPLPSPATLVLQTLFLAGQRGPSEPPPRGALVEQPAAAALALRREVLHELGGLDEGFYPAWFEDVDLARRLADAGHRLFYEPEARFTHAGGATVEKLGYGEFQWVYYRHLVRYLAKHHGSAWAILASAMLPIGMALRLALVPLRRPRRAESRSAAAAGLASVIAGAVSGWRRPKRVARRFQPGEDA